MNERQMRDRLQFREAEPPKASTFWGVFISLLCLGIGAVIAYVLYQQDTKPLAPPVARHLSKAITVKDKGYLIQVGPAIVREAEPSTALAAVQIVTDAGKPAWLACTLSTPEGIPLGGGSMGNIHQTFGGSMPLQGPLLSEGVMKCNVMLPSQRPVNGPGQ
jgi:hypothetical protein